MHRRLVAAVAIFVLVAVVFTPSAVPQEPTDADEQVLKSAGLPTDTAALLHLLRLRTLQDNDRKGIETLLRQLDSDEYEQRQQANDELLKHGPKALPFLKAALSGNVSPELRRRAEDMIRKLDTVVGRETTAAAARLLASRQADGAIEVLLGYLPNTDDAWLEEDVLASLGRLSIKQGEPDAKLLAALKDPLPQRRAAVLYLLGRRGNVAQRAVVRSFLADPDPLLRERAGQGIVGKGAWQNLLDGGPADEAALKGQNIAASEAALLEFLRKRTPDTAEQARLTGLVQQLGSLEYEDRHYASEALVKAGTAALAFLRPAVLDPDAEFARRARRCLDEIQRNHGPTVPAAVVRRLAWPGLVTDSPAAVGALLGFVPFSEDESVEEEVLHTLALLGVRQVKVDPALTAALDDPLPARRAAAAYALGCVGTAEHLAAVRKRLADDAVAVRWRAAEGLFAARDKAAVPKLIALLGELPPTHTGRVEELLNRLAGDQVPADTGAMTPTGRQQAVLAWRKWWQQQQDTIDLARATEGDSFLGLLTICEYDNVVPGKFTGQVWEAPRNGPARVKIGDLVGPMDAQALPNGRILVAENGANRVTERDRTGAIKWDYQIQGGNPICCQRLPNGNTFIALYNQLLEVRPDRSEVYRYNPGPQFYIFSARKTRTGTVVCITAQNTILEVDPLQNKTLRSINLGQPAGGWAGIEPLPNGNFLVATMSNNSVREVDTKGNTVWSFTSLPGVFRATRLPSGNFIVASMNTREVAEVDRNGAVRWRQTCQGRPWSVRYR